MLREDGTIRVYMIQVKESHPEFEDGTWRFASLANGWGYGTVTGFGPLTLCDLPPHTGGTTDVDEAYTGLTEISRRWPSERFRLVLIELEQKTRVLAHAKDGATAA